jgi:hypothetical protein
MLPYSLRRRQCEICLDERKIHIAAFIRALHVVDTRPYFGID